MEQINLLEDPTSAVGRDLLDDLDGVLDPGVDVDAGLNRGISPLSQHLPRQGVNFLERVRGKRSGTW